MLNPRGSTRNRKYATQARDFTGLQYGNITPTDLDGMIEFHNRCYIFIEAKYDGADMDPGQETALSRLCDDMRKPSILIIARHRHPYPDAIDFANCGVEKYRWDGKWHPWAGSVRDLVDTFIRQRGR